VLGADDSYWSTLSVTQVTTIGLGRSLRTPPLKGHGSRRTGAKSDPLEVIRVSAVDADRESSNPHLAQLALPVQTM